MGPNCPVDGSNGLWAWLDGRVLKIRAYNGACVAHSRAVVSEALRARHQNHIQTETQLNPCLTTQGRDTHTLKPRTRGFWFPAPRLLVPVSVECSTPRRCRIRWLLFRCGQSWACNTMFCDTGNVGACVVDVDVLSDVQSVPK